MSTPDTGNQGPWWLSPILKSGAWGLLVFLLLGFIPGVPSPINTLSNAIAKHDQDTRDVLLDIRHSTLQTCLNTAKDDRAANRCWRPVNSR